MGKTRVHLVVIDPQNDFMDQAGATLPVTGATEDMRRLAKLIGRVSAKLDDIHVTLDSHRVIDIAHPGMWRNENGDHPAPFTLIGTDDVKNGIWTPRNPAYRQRALAYVTELARQGNYPLIIWPEHCLIGSPGHGVQAELLAALQVWERKNFANVNYITKGTNTFTEHYGALMAEVPDPEDPSTQLNAEFLAVLADADIVVLAGEASSHCVKATVDQIAKHIGDEHIKKFHLLVDCMSPVGAVPGVDFPAIAAAWLKDMEKKGMTLVKADDFLR